MIVKYYPKQPLVVIAFCLLFIFSNLSSWSQQQSVDNMSDGQVKAFYDKAKASGMSEMQIEQAALQQGYTLTDIAKMRKKVSEMKAKTGANSEAKDDTLAAGRKQTVGTSSIPAPKAQNNGSVIFGSEFFDKPSVTFEPNLRIASPKNYQLGPDDELHVEIYGAAVNTYKLKVSPEGTVKVRELAPIYVSGLTIEEAKERIFSRLNAMYAGLGSGSASVTLGNIRSIKVIVTGEAKKPGTYTVSSLATAFNVLTLCGGPTDKGSMRNISVIRGNKIVRHIDFYEFLLKADQASNLLLQDQDIIQIPYYNTRVKLEGEIKRPAIYEMKADETFKNVLEFAGNFSDSAYTSHVAVERFTDKERKIINLLQDNFATFKPKSGDIYKVAPILNRYENKVEITGAIFRGGVYALDENLRTFKQLIKKADGFREDAARQRVLIYRERENLEPEILTIDAEKIFLSENPDVELHKNDRLVVKSLKDLREKYFVSILGEVNKPTDTEYADNMTVSDLVFAAGGFTDGAIGSRIEIARRIRDKNQSSTPEESTIEIISLKIDKQLRLTPNDALFKLEPFDIVHIRKSPRYEVQKNAVIVGEVNYPGSYAIANNEEKISDLIQRAGSIKKTGYLPGVMLIRNKERIAIDIAKILENNSVVGNLLLLPDDSLYIPRKSETVKITGAVLNPSVINFEKGFVFKDYLSQAGGYNEIAQKRKAFVTYPNGYTQRTKNFLFFKKYPKVEPGSEIYVPLKVKKDGNKTDYTPMLMTFATSILIILLNKKL